MHAVASLKQVEIDGGWRHFLLHHVMALIVASAFTTAEPCWRECDCENATLRDRLSAPENAKRHNHTTKPES